MTDTESASRDIEIRRVETRTDLEHFVRMPAALYKRDENWVPQLLVERRAHFSARHNPYFEHADVALWTAWRYGEPVGRISAQVCHLYQERYRDETGHFGSLEAIDDSAVFDLLLDTASQWLADRGMKRMSGPFTLSINEETGLLVDGFDTPPSMMMNHAHPYYAQHLERIGFTKLRDLYAYDYSRQAELPRAVATMLERTRASGDLEIRSLDKRNFDRDLEIIIEIFNDAWQENWGFVPMTLREINALGKNMKMLAKGDFVAIAYYKGEPAAMAVTLPNINDAIADLDGRLLPFGWAKMLWRLKAKVPKTVRMPLMGVKSKYQSDVVGSALAAAVVDRIRTYHRDRGTQSCELSWILEDNRRVRKLIELVGGKHYKTYRVYGRDLSANGAA